MSVVGIQGARGADSGLSVATRAALLGLNPTTAGPGNTAIGTQTLVTTRGFATNGDGGHATYRWVEGDTTTTDGVTILAPTNIDAPVGRWRLQWRDELDARWAGFLPNAPGQASAAAAWEALRLAVAAGVGKTVRLPAGAFYLPPQMNLPGAGSPAMIMVDPSTTLTGPGSAQLTLYCDVDSWDLVSPPPAGTQRTLRWFLCRSYSQLRGFTVDGQKDLIDRNVHRNVAFMPIRAYEPDGEGHNGLGIAIQPVIRDVEASYCYVETRFWNVTAVDTTTDVLTLDDDHGLDVGDSVKLGGATGSATVVQDGTTRLWNGTIAVIETVPATNQLSLSGVDLTMTPAALGQVYDLVESRTLTTIEGFAIQWGAHLGEAYDIKTHYNDGTGFSPGSASTDALLWGQSGVNTMVASTDRIASKAKKHYLQVGDHVTFSGVTGAMVSIAGAGAVSVNGQTGVVASIISAQVYTLTDWNITVDGSGGFAYSPEAEARQPRGGFVRGLHTTHNGWQGISTWRMGDYDGEDIVAEYNERTNLNQEFNRGVHFRRCRAKGGGLNDMRIVGYSVDCGFDDVVCEGAATSEIRMDAGASDVYNGCPQNLTLRDITVKGTPVRHIYEKVSDTVNVGTGHVTGSVEGSGFEEWGIFAHNIRTLAGSRILTAGDTQTAGGLVARGVQHSAEIQLPPLGMWTPSTGTAVAELSLKTGAISEHPVAFTVSNDAVATWAFGILPKAKRYLIEARILVPPGDSFYNEYSVRVTRITGGTALVRQTVESPKSRLAEQWVTKRFFATIPDADLYQDHQIQVGRARSAAIPGGTAGEVHVDYIRAWVVDPGPIEPARDLTQRRYAEFYDDGGTGGATTGAVMKDGWAFNDFGTSTGATLSQGVSETDHPMVTAFTTASATAHQRSVIYGGSGQSLLLGTPWLIWFAFREAAVYGNPTRLFVGLTSNAGAATPNDGLYLDRLLGANYRFIARKSNVETAVDLGRAADAAHKRVAIRQLSPTTYGFRLDGNTEVLLTSNAALASIATVTANLPTSNPRPFFSIDNGGGGAAVGFNFDAFYMRVWTNR